MTEEAVKEIVATPEILAAPEQPMTWWQKVKARNCCGADRKCCNRDKLDDKKFEKNIDNAERLLQKILDQQEEYEKNSKVWIPTPVVDKQATEVDNKPTIIE